MADQTAIKVRRVTDLHANWSAQGEGQRGKFSFQLILDDGAEEAVIRPPAEDAKVVTKLFLAGNTFYFDTERRTLMLNDIE